MEKGLCAVKAWANILFIEYNKKIYIRAPYVVFTAPYSNILFSTRVCIPLSYKINCINHLINSKNSRFPKDMRRSMREFLNHRTNMDCRVHPNQQQHHLHSISPVWFVACDHNVNCKQLHFYCWKNSKNEEKAQLYTTCY